MPKIKCPHCGANNQDMTEKDRCWQCDVVLGAPVVVADPVATVPTPVQKQVEPVPLPPTKTTPQSRFPVAPVAVGIALVIVLLLVVLAIVFFVMKK